MTAAVSRPRLPVPAIETVNAYGGTVIADGITGTPASWPRPSLVANGLDPDRLAKPAERAYDSTADVAARCKHAIRAALLPAT